MNIPASNPFAKPQFGHVQQPHFGNIVDQAKDKLLELKQDVFQKSSAVGQ